MLADIALVNKYASAALADPAVPEAAKQQLQAEIAAAEDQLSALHELASRVIAEARPTEYFDTVDYRCKKCRKVWGYLGLAKGNPLRWVLSLPHAPQTIQNPDGFEGHCGCGRAVSVSSADMRLAVARGLQYRGKTTTTV